jgi:hypothetical protein
MEWQWPKRRIFSSLISILEGPLSLGIGGLRRCGKTTLLKQLIGHFCSKHLPKRSLYFQFDRDLLIKNANALENVLNIYFLDILNESLGSIQDNVYIFLDEIQFVPMWSEILKRYMDRDPAIRFVVSGSSSLILESDATESLAGRMDMIRLMSPDFRDYMIIQGKKPPPEIKHCTDYLDNKNELHLFYGEKKDLLIHDYLEYLRWGGFPQLKEIPDENARRRYITDVVVKKILRFDLPVRFSGENPMDLERLYEIYTTENGQLIEYETLSRDISLSVFRLKHLSQALIAGYLIFYCYNHTKSKRKAGRTGKKVYLSTPSLMAHKFGPLEQFPEILGRIVENDVFLRLHALNTDVQFFRKNRQEIDFIIEHAGKRIPIECKTGRLRSNALRLIRSMTEKWQSPFGILVTLNHFDLRDPGLLKIPAYLL